MICFTTINIWEFFCSLEKQQCLSITCRSMHFHWCVFFLWEEGCFFLAPLAQERRWGREPGATMRLELQRCTLWKVSRSYHKRAGSLMHHKVVPLGWETTEGCFVSCHGDLAFPLMSTAIQLTMPRGCRCYKGEKKKKKGNSSKFPLSEYLLDQVMW